MAESEGKRFRQVSRTGETRQTNRVAQISGRESRAGISKERIGAQPQVLQGNAGIGRKMMKRLFAPKSSAAVRLANDSPYGLTSCIHTKSVHRAMEFTRVVQAGVVAGKHHQGRPGIDHHSEARAVDNRLDEKMS